MIGVDLTSSEARPTACVVLNSDGGLVDASKLATDEDIVRLVHAHRPAVVAIDSPLGLPLGMDCLEETHECLSVHPFKGRLCERELVTSGIPLYLTTKRSIIKSMVYRAMALAPRIGALGPKVIEVYPYASKVFLFGRDIPKKTTAEGREFLTDRLAGLIPGLAPAEQVLDHDTLDALTAAYTAHLFTLGRTQVFGIPEEVQIHVPIRSSASQAPRPGSSRLPVSL